MRTRKASLPRILVAGALLVALLSGVAPVSATSTGHLCTMECCVGLPAHEAGSCHLNMSGGKKTAEPEPVKNCGMMEAGDGVTDGVAAGVMGTQETPNSSFDEVTIDVSDVSDVPDASDASDHSDHCHMNSHSDGEGSPAHDGPSQLTSMAAQSFSRPCPPECGTGAVSFGVRPSRNAAALAHNVRPRPPTLTRTYRSFEGNLFNTSACGEQVGPRGPPVSFS